MVLAASHGPARQDRHHETLGLPGPGAAGDDDGAGSSLPEQIPCLELVLVGLALAGESVIATPWPGGLVECFNELTLQHRRDEALQGRVGNSQPKVASNTGSPTKQPGSPGFAAKRSLRNRRSAGFEKPNRLTVARAARVANSGSRTEK